jgi:tripartite-type tricarboxylate transporter receptor subunit TctC
MPRSVIFVSCLLAAVLAWGGRLAAAEDVAAFYAGKTLRLIVGTSPGATYDIWARLLGRQA